MIRTMTALAVALPLALVACKGDDAAGTPGAAGSAGAKPASTGAAATPTGAAATAAGAATGAGASAGAAAAFPATALTAKKLEGFTIGLPPGGKIDKASDDKGTVDTADYKLMVSVGKNELADMKAMLGKVPGTKIIVDQPDGLVAEMEAKGAKEYVLTRYVTIGSDTVVCETAATKSAKTEAKAKEAFDVCGTVKKK